MSRMIGNDKVISALLEEAGHLSGFTQEQIRAHFEKGLEQLREQNIALTGEDRKAILYYTTHLTPSSWMVVAQLVGASVKEIVEVLRQELDDMS